MEIQSRRLIRPKRFVWHVSYNYNDRRIGAEGLLMNKEGYVYANNHSYNLMDMWPFPIDLFDWMGLQYSKYEFFSGYTFWRIDTRICNGVWEVDPHLTIDYKAYDCLPPRNYIRTPADIPIKALCPFRYSGDNYSNIKVKYAEGQASVGCRASGLMLREDYPLWNWMNWRIKQPELSRAA